MSIRKKTLEIIEAAGGSIDCDKLYKLIISSGQLGFGVEPHDVLNTLITEGNVIFDSPYGGSQSPTNLVSLRTGNRKKTDGPADCDCHFCDDKLAGKGEVPCEGANHHCEYCHDKNRCTTLECLNHSDSSA
jgi:hypothetical protein